MMSDQQLMRILCVSSCDLHLQKRSLAMRRYPKRRNIRLWGNFRRRRAHRVPIITTTRIPSGRAVTRTVSNMNTSPCLIWRRNVRLTPMRMPKVSFQIVAKKVLFSELGNIETDKAKNMWLQRNSHFYSFFLRIA